MTKGFRRTGVPLTLLHNNKYSIYRCEDTDPDPRHDVSGFWPTPPPPKFKRGEEKWGKGGKSAEIHFFSSFFSFYILGRGKKGYPAPHLISKYTSINSTISFSYSLLQYVRFFFILCVVDNLSLLCYCFIVYRP